MSNENAEYIICPPSYSPIDINFYDVSKYFHSTITASILKNIKDICRKSLIVIMTILVIITFCFFGIASARVTQITDIQDQDFPSVDFRFDIPISYFSTTINDSSITLVVDNLDKIPSWVETNIFTRSSNVGFPILLNSGVVDFHVQMDGIAFVTFQQQIRKYDITEGITFLTNFDVSGKYVQFFSSYVEGDYVMIAGGVSGWWLLDVFFSQLDRKQQNVTRDVFIQYPYGYALNYIGDYERSILMIDLSNKDDIKIVANLDITEKCTSNSFQVRNNFVYMVDFEGFKIYELLGTPPFEISPLSMYADNNYYGGVIIDFSVLNDNFILIFFGLNPDSSRIQMLRYLENENKMILISELSFPVYHGKPKSLEVVGGIAISSCTESFEIIDISDPYNISLIQSVSTFDTLNFCSNADEMFHGTASSYKNHLIAICEKSMSLHKFGDLWISDDSFFEEDCDMAFKVNVLASDIDFDFLQIKDTSSQASFILNNDCTPGPSIVEKIGNQTAVVSEEFVMIIPFHDAFFGTNHSSFSMIARNQPKWVSETKVDIVYIDKSFSHSCPNSLSRSLFVRESSSDPKILYVYVAETSCFRVLKYSLYSGRFEPLYLEADVPAIKIVSDGSFVYVIDMEGSLEIYDLTDPEKGVYHATGIENYNFTDISLEFGNNFILLSRGKFPGGMIVVDIHDPYNPQIVKDIPSENLSIQITVNGEHSLVFLIEPEDVVVYRMLASNNKELFQDGIDGSFETFATQGDFLYLWSFTEGLLIFNISSNRFDMFDLVSQTTPQEEKGIERIYYTSMDVYGDYLLMGSEKNTIIVVLDISNPYEPVFLGSRDFSDIIIFSDNVNDVSFNNGLIFSACGASMAMVIVSEFDNMNISGKPVSGNCEGSEMEIIAKDSTGMRVQKFNVFVDGICDDHHDMNNNTNGGDGDVEDNTKSWIIIIPSSVVLLCCCVLCSVCLFAVVGIIFCCCVIICFSFGCFTVYTRTRSGSNDEKGEYFPIGESTSVNSSTTSQKFAPDAKISCECVINFKRIKLLEVIGAGGGGAIIYRAKWRGKIVCIKMFKAKSLFKRMTSGEDVAYQMHADFEREIKMMRSLSHPNILRSYGCVLKQPMIGIVMDFCENGDLEECIQENKLDSFMESIRVIREVTSGMSFLHEKKIIHRDLKPKNVLLDRNLVVKIMDFGLSRMASETTAMTKAIGTSYFMAPEIVREEVSYSYPVDIFAFSILVFITLTKDVLPYGDKSGFRIEMKVCSDPDFRPKMDPKIEVDVRNRGFGWLLDFVMKKGWVHDPSQRPTFLQIEEMFDSFCEKFEKQKEKVGDFFVEEDIDDE